MNVFIPLILGLLTGYILRKRETLRKYIEYMITISLLLLIFFLGMRTGSTKIDTLYLLLVSLLFAVLATGMSVLFASLMERVVK